MAGDGRRYVTCIRWQEKGCGCEPPWGCEPDPRGELHEAFHEHDGDEASRQAAVDLYILQMAARHPGVVFAKRIDCGQMLLARPPSFPTVQVQPRAQRAIKQRKARAPKQPTPAKRRQSFWAWLRSAWSDQ